MTLYILTFIISWIAFWLTADRARLLELFIYGIFGSLISFIVMSVESVMDWWEFIQFDEGQEVAVQLLLSLSLYAVEVMLLIQFLPKLRSGWLKWTALASAFALMNTGCEAILLRLKMVKYMMGWNLGWTLVSYLIPFAMSFLFSLPYRAYFARVNR